MKDLAAGLPPALAHLLIAFARRRARLRAASWLALALALLSGLFFLALLVDRVVELPPLLRAGLPLLTLLLPTVTALAGLYEWLRPRSADAAAALLDRALPDGRDVLRSALDFQRREKQEPGEIDPFMLRATHSLAGNASGRLEPRRLLRTRPVWKRLAVAVIFAGVITGLALTPYLPFPLMWQRFADPFGNYPRPSFTLIDVAAPATQTIAEGDDLTVHVQLAGRLEPGQRAELVVERAGGLQYLQMSPAPGHRFATQLTGVREPFRFLIRAGDGRTARYAVSVLPRPRLSRVAVRYDYPRYTRLPRLDETLKDWEMKGVAGTRVRLEFDSSLAVKDSWVQFPNRRYRIQWDRDRTRGNFRFTIEEDTSFFLHLQADNGTVNRGETPFRVRALPDNPPTVTIRGMPEPPSFFREDLLNLEYSISDDFGIAELYLRSWAGLEREPKNYSVQFDKSVEKKADGSVSVKLSEFAEEDETMVRMELVAVDTRGQESATPRMELQIISETPDRQLAELIEFQDESLKLAYRTRLRQNDEQLRAQLGNLRILLDGMDETTPLDGKRRGMFDSLLVHLRGVDTQTPDYTYVVVSEYPYLNQRRVEYAVSLPYLLRGRVDYEEAFKRILAAPNPCRGLKEFLPLLEEEQGLCEAILQANEDVLKENRLSLMSFLAEKAWLLLSGPAANVPEFADRLRQQRRDLITRVLELGTTVGGDDLSQLLAPLTEVATLKEPEETQLLAALAQVHQGLSGGVWLSGKLGTGLERFHRDWPWPRLMRRAVETKSVDRLLRVLHDIIRLRQDVPVPEDTEFFLLLRAHAALTTGDPQRIRQAADAIARHQAWSERFTLLERLRLLRLRFHDLRLDAAVGRRLPVHPSFDRAWHELREIPLATVREAAAGRWQELEPAATAALAKLDQAAVLFRPWTARLAWTAPDFAARADALEAELGDFIALLEPQVVQGLPTVIAEWPLLAADVTASMTRELPLLAVEQSGIRQEVKEGMAKKATMSKEEMKESKWTWNSTSHKRHEYAVAIVDRCSGWLLAADRALALREWLWVRQPTAPAQAELEAFGLFVDHLQAVAEEIYDNTRGAYLNRPGGQYPNYLNPICDYYGKMQNSLLPDLTRWFGLAAAQPAALAQDQAYAAATARRATAGRFRDWRQMLVDHRDFHDFIAAKPEPQARQARLLTLGEGPLRAVYWDLVVLALNDLGTAVQGALPQKPDAAFTGLAPEVRQQAATAAENLAFLLPAAPTAGAEFEPLRGIVSDWRHYSGRIAPEAVKALTADKQQLLRDDLADWLGRLAGVRRSVDDFLRVPPPQFKPRRRYTDVQRYDYLMTLGRLIRNDARWTERVAEAEHGILAQRARYLASRDGQPTAVDQAWAVSLTQRLRRQCASVINRKNQGLGGETAGPSALVLKMPPHLYEELMRASEQPYPTQFKDPGLAYIKTLVQEAR